MPIPKFSRWLLSFFLLPIPLWAATISTQQLPAVIDQFNQNALMYAGATPDKILMDAATQAKVSQVFLNRYFSAWTGNQVAFRQKDALEAETDFVKLYAARPGFGSNMHPLSLNWIQGLADNMNLAAFANMKVKGIVVNSDNLRQLPTDIPSFSTVSALASDYPFDSLQQSYIASGSPVFIWQVSRDGAWYLVMTENQLGWIHANSVAIVGDSFVHKWQANHFVMANDDNIPIMDDDHIFRMTSRIGILYPLVGTSKSAYTIYVPVVNTENHAIIRQGSISKTYATAFPLALTQDHIAMIANKILGDSYGWGGIYGFRDCSATMKDIFAVFGIWLPRNSAYQAKAGQYISLTGLTDKQKLIKIRQLGVPFITFIDLPGHIALYLNDPQNKVMTLQTIWGLRTQADDGMGRAVIGETVIMPMDIDAQYSNITSTLMSRVTGITLIVPQDSSS
ncbi:MAG: SH3 domain-containing protein [Gammaproteobacteria bacterium]|nr:SH3 domain-containing protein [Gammaproteobacteria bacterium]